MEIVSKLGTNQTDAMPCVAMPIEDLHEVFKIAIDLIESAKQEVLVMLSTTAGCHCHEKTGLLSSLKKLSRERDVSIRIVVPRDDAMKRLSSRTSKTPYKLDIRFIEQPLSPMLILIVDKTYSLLVRKDDPNDAFYVDVCTYHSNKATILSYTSMFESLWSTLKLHEDVQESNKKLQQSNRTLSMMKQKYRNLYEKSPSLLRSVNTEGVLIDCNEAYATVLGYSKEEAIGMSIYAHTAEKSLAEMRKNFEEWKITHDIFTREIWMKKRDGTIFPCLLTGTNLFDERGNLMGRTGALTDLTGIYDAKMKIEERESRLREQFEELKELNNKLQTRDRMQNEFINVAAHELRSPIQPIVGLAQVLKNKKGEISEQTSLIDTIIRSAEKLQRVAENILDVTRIESDTLLLYKEQINLRELLYDIFQTTKYQLHLNYEEKDIMMQFEAKEDIYVTVDRARLTQVVLNLLGNAIKFTDKGVIAISAEKTNDGVLVSVKDTGKGISETVLPKLFTKYVTSNTGTGLGLFISQKIVEAHGGKMWAENNREGRGATVTFTIPVNGICYQ